MKIDLRVRVRPILGPGRYGARPFDRRETWNTFAFLVALGLPFAFAGLWGLSQVPAKWAAHDSYGAFFHAAAGFAFATVGLGLIAGSLWARGRVARDAALALAHPDEPWKWREDWAAGYVLDRPANLAWMLGAFAVLWNAIAFPLGILGFQAMAAKQQPYAAFALLFPLAGLLLVVKSYGVYARARAQGVSRLVLDAVPVPVGRTLSGTVKTRMTAVPAGGFELVFSALRTTRTGADDDPSTTIVWQEEARAAGQPMGDVDGVHVGVPVAFRIPVEAPSTDRSDPHDEIEWKLIVRAQGYEATFDVPVYRTEESGVPETARDVSHLRVVPAGFAVPPIEVDAPRPGPPSVIEVSRDGTGVMLDFPPARNPGSAWGVTAFAALWTAAIALLMRLHFPVFFAVLFVLFDVVFVWLALRMWFETVRVRADRAGVRVARGLAQPGAERSYAAGDIRDVRLSIGMSSGTKAWYDLGLFLEDGRRIRLGEGVRSKREAEWLAAQILRALGR